MLVLQMDGDKIREQDSIAILNWAGQSGTNLHRVNDDARCGSEERMQKLDLWILASDQS